MADIAPNVKAGLCKLVVHAIAEAVVTSGGRCMPGKPECAGWFGDCTSDGAADIPERHRLCIAFDDLALAI